MRHAEVLAPLALLVAALAGCIEEESTHKVHTTSNPPAQVNDSSIPCDVAQVIATHCASCHNATLEIAGVNLTSYATLSAPSKADPSMSLAARAVVRMRGSTSPMPPTGTIPDAEIAVVDKWVKAGLPMGSCGSTSTQPNVTVQCTSKQTYALGNDGHGDMYPGRACIACHDSSVDAPVLQFGGTLYPTTHEPDDCIGRGGATVVIKDAQGTTYTETVRPSGNFYLQSENAIAFPITAEIHQGGKVLKMSNPAPSGDCNSCHTALGANGAPGRLVGP